MTNPESTRALVARLADVVAAVAMHTLPSDRGVRDAYEIAMAARQPEPQDETGTQSGDGVRVAPERAQGDRVPKDSEPMPATSSAPNSLTAPSSPAPASAREPRSAATPIPLGADEKPFDQTMDAKLWAQEFVRRFPAHDEGLMLAWFANAIMRGYDTARAKYEHPVATRETVERVRNELMDTMLLSSYDRAKALLSAAGFTVQV